MEYLVLVLVLSEIAYYGEHTKEIIIRTCPHV